MDEDVCKCIYCGEIIRKKAAFCEYCGKMQVPEDIAMIKYCSYCGAKIIDNNSYCPECGNNIDRQEEKEEKVADDEYETPIGYTCPHCGDTLKTSEESYINYKNENVIELRGYCKKCDEDYLLEVNRQSLSKKDSTLSVIACVLVGVEFIFEFLGGLPLIYVQALMLAGFIIALVDLGMRDKTKRHIGSWFAIIINILVMLLISGSIFK